MVNELQTMDGDVVLVQASRYADLLVLTMIGDGVGGTQVFRFSLADAKNMRALLDQEIEKLEKVFITGQPSEERCRDTAGS